MPQHITVVDYDPDWPRQFQAEAARIRAVLGDNCTAIYHIGSTAVPGLAAKPILDIMPVVENLEAVDRAAPAFEAMGYEYLGEFGIPGRRYLRKGGDERTHQLHIFARTDRANITRHLAVRDYLRAHREAREEYARLKRALARQFPYDIDGYCLGKEGFVQALEQAALEEFINFKEGSAMRRADREVTDRNQLEEILKACHAVHIGAQDGDGMFVVPMNYGFHLEGDRLTLYVHSAQEGRKVSAFRAGGTVAFEMDGRHALRTADTACGHSYTYQSIMGSGPIRELTGREEKRAALGRIMEHMTGRGGWDMPDASLDRTAVFAIQADQWTGKSNQAG